MGWLAKLLHRTRSGESLRGYQAHLAVMDEVNRLHVDRELRLLPPVCGEATKAGTPCLKTPAEGYAACSSHGGRNAAPVKRSASQAG